jgi:GNAT superfamily N-acetyltransferase
VPEQWPRVGARYEQAGLVHDGHTEIVYMASVGARLAEAAISGLLVRRSVGSNGTRLAAMPGDEMIGDIEVLSHDDAGRLLRSGGWADIGNLHVAEGYRRRGVATWLMGQAAAWLRQSDRPHDLGHDDWLARAGATGHLPRAAGEQGPGPRHDAAG